MCLGSLGAIDEIWSEGDLPMASVDGSAVCLMYTPEARVGEVVLHHMGFSVEIVDDERASSALGLRSAWAEFETTKET